jgi:hypothetical protein
MRLVAIIALAPTLAFAEPLPQPKPSGPGGSCPHGYTASRSYCVPSQGAQDAIPKPPNGTCPWGWTSSGSYCLRSGSPSSPQENQGDCISSNSRNNQRSDTEN